MSLSHINLKPFTKEKEEHGQCKSRDEAVLLEKDMTMSLSNYFNKICEHECALHDTIFEFFRSTQPKLTFAIIPE